MRVRVFLGVAVIVALGLAGCNDGETTAPVEDTPPLQARALQDALEDARSASALVGAQAAVSAGGRLWTGSSGDADEGKPVDDDTLFAIGSIAKTLTATLVLKLAEEGKLTLDDQLSRWLPDYPRADQITLRMLLDHSSGIDDFAESKAFWDFVESGAEVRPEDALRFVDEPRFAPGEGYFYSNTNTLLLGLVIEKASGSTYVAELDRVIRKPLGIEDDIYFPPEESFPTDRLSHHYGDFNRDGTREDLTEQGLPTGYQWSGPFAEGAAVATSRGLARFGQALFAGDLVSEESLAEMTAFHDVPEPYDQGLGLHRATIGGLESWGHHGLGGGFWSQLSYYPELEAVVAVVANEGGPAKDTPAIEEALLNVLRG